MKPTESSSIDDKIFPVSPRRRGDAPTNALPDGHAMIDRWEGHRDRMQFDHELVDVSPDGGQGGASRLTMK